MKTKETKKRLSFILSLITFLAITCVGCTSVSNDVNNSDEGMNTAAADEDKPASVPEENPAAADEDKPASVPEENTAAADQDKPASVPE